MRAAGANPGVRRRYRQLLRSMLREEAVFLDKKGRLSIDPRPATEMPRRTGKGAKSASRRRGAEEAAREKEAGEATSRPGTILARFEGHRDGFGFVNPTDGSRDVFIPPHRTGGAMHGDLVEYGIVSTQPGGRREGRVVRVARPVGHRVVGLVSRVSPVVEVVPFDPRAGARYWLPSVREPDVAEGVAVEIEISRSPGSRSESARLLEVLGPISRPGVDIEVLIRKHHLRVDFPESVLAECEAIGDEIPRSHLQGRADFSSETVVTIDGDTARDFDDAVSVMPAPRRGFHLAVHIADVAHYVQPGSATDIEARLRGTSTYFPGRAIPMLPPTLSENICSLKPGVPRLVQSVLITFDSRGEPVGVRFSDGWIRSRARLTYGRVNALLKGAPPVDGEIDLLADLRRMNELASRLASRRADRGGLDFDLPEPEVVLDALGAAAGVRPAQRGPAQRLIEEFMIAANMAVARFITESFVETLHRVHEKPDPLRVTELARTAAAFGLDFDPEPENVKPTDFRALLDQLAGRPEERSLGRLLLRTMALARYSPQPLGHFGLAAEHYLHFTSPIRRYPDLVAHRSLRIARGRMKTGDGGDEIREEDRGGAPHKPAGKGRSASVSRLAAVGKRSRRRARAHAGENDGSAMAIERGVAGEDLDVLAVDCSRLERVAEAAERESLAWKRAEVLLGRLGDEMDGTVSSVSPQGIFVELDEVYAEGLLPLSALPEDRYAYDSVRLSLCGERTGRTHRAGQRLRVLVARVDRITQRVELALAGSAGGGLPALDRAVGEYAFSRSGRRRPGEPSGAKSRGGRRARKSDR